MTKRENTENLCQTEQPAMSTNQGTSNEARCKMTKYSMHEKQIVEVTSDEDTELDDQEDVECREGDQREDPVVHDQSKSQVFSSQLPQLQATKEGWVIWVVHPDKGQFVVKEGINLVGEEHIVSGGAIQGFFSAPVPDTHKLKIRENERLVHTQDTVVFPNLLMLSPNMRRLAESAVDLALFGPGEVTASYDMPDDVIFPVPIPRGNYSATRPKATP